MKFMIMMENGGDFYLVLAFSSLYYQPSENIIQLCYLKKVISEFWNGMDNVNYGRALCLLTFRHKLYLKQLVKLRTTGREFLSMRVEMCIVLFISRLFFSLGGYEWVFY